MQDEGYLDFQAGPGQNTVFHLPPSPPPPSPPSPTTKCIYIYYNDDFDSKKICTDKTVRFDYNSRQDNNPDGCMNALYDSLTADSFGNFPSVISAMMPSDCSQLAKDRQNCCQAYWDGHHDL